MQQSSDAAYFYAAAEAILKRIIEQDPVGCENAIKDRVLTTWVQSRIESADASSFPGVHKYAVCSVASKLRGFSDSNPRLMPLYENWGKAPQMVAEALSLEAARLAAS